MKIENILLLVFIVGFTGCVKERPTSYNINYAFKNIDLNITSKNKIFSLSKKEYPKIKISLNNFTKEEMKMVQPGDGSDVGWRTPIVRWSVLDMDSKEENEHPKSLPGLNMKNYGRCGNMNGLSAKEIITLKPGYGIKLNGWAGHPPIPRKKGKYSVKFYYKNDPNMEWVTRGYSTNKGKKIIKDETHEYLLISNELIIKIVE